MFGVNNESEYEKAVLKPIIAGMSAVSIAKTQVLMFLQTLTFCSLVVTRLELWNR